MEICCFKGYKPFFLPYGKDESDPRCQKLKGIIEQTVKKVIAGGCRHFICGFDQGADMLFAETIVKLKVMYPYIKLESVIPYEDQASKWSETERERYFELLAHCDTETMLQAQYASDCLTKRNKYMVNKSDILIAVYNGRLSGAMEAVTYAKLQGKTIFSIDPETLEVTDKV